MTPTMRQRALQLAEELQEELTSELERLDGGRFGEDRWERPGGGGGRSRTLERGDVFEKAGVNVSAVHGVLPEDAARALGGRGLIVPDAARPLSFFATGVSVVLHPWNPMAPTAHCNYRYLELGEEAAPSAWWFGGGADLTPSYLFDDDATHFHRVHKDACDRFDKSFYGRFKRWCDEYFFIAHRNETRGVGGIFFDDLHDRPAGELLDFCRACGEAFRAAYLPLVARRRDAPYEEQHRHWQLLRRGRYVEFNLVYDRGTTFGLRTGGRTESILMSLPPLARWDHAPQVAPGSEEERLLEVLRKPRDWVF